MEVVELSLADSMEAQQDFTALGRGMEHTEGTVGALAMAGGVGATLVGMVGGILAGVSVGDGDSVLVLDGVGVPTGHPIHMRMDIRILTTVPITRAMLVPFPPPRTLPRTATLETLGKIGRDAILIVRHLTTTF